ncbi:MAG: GlxA family transcriptional regulator, partial [Pseudomonadota bacterium]
MIFSQSDAALSVDLWILPNVSLLSLASVMEPMRGANRVAGRSLFQWRLLSPSGTSSHSSSGLPIAVSGPADAETDADAVIALASFEVESHGIELLPRLRRAARRGLAV